MTTLSLSSATPSSPKLFYSSECEDPYPSTFPRYRLADPSSFEPLRPSEIDYQILLLFIKFQHSYEGDLPWVRIRVRLQGLKSLIAPSTEEIEPIKSPLYEETVLVGLDDPDAPQSSDPFFANDLSYLCARAVYGPTRGFSVLGELCVLANDETDTVLSRIGRFSISRGQLH